MIMYYEMQRLWKRAAVTYFKALSSICLKGLKKSMENLSPDIDERIILKCI